MDNRNQPLVDRESIEFKPNRSVSIDKQHERDKDINTLEKGMEEIELTAPLSNNSGDNEEDGNTILNANLYPIDFNSYQQKKTLAQGMMDLALLSANANQLRYVLEQPSESRSGFFYASLTFISLSIILQIFVGVGLIWNGQYNIKKKNHCHKANKVNNFTIIGIFIITILNVLISAFGIPSTTPAKPLLSSNLQFSGGVSEDTELLVNFTTPV
ncbi:ninjurin-A-like isoform X2 [Lycorma delicatula]